MIFPLLLALLCLATEAQAQELTLQQPPSLVDAARLADEGNTAAALDSFRRIAAANPDDHAARLWIALLHERMGHPGLARPVYESVLLEDPANLKARLGLVATLLAGDDSDRALELLEPIEDGEAQNPMVLTLLARAHRMEGRSELSLDYYRRAAAADPTEPRRMAFETARARYAHLFETRGFSEQYNGSTPDSRSGEVSIDYRFRERWRLLGRGQVQRKLGVSEHRLGGGAAWEWMPGLTLRGHALLGPDNVVMPEGDYLGELAYAYRSATWILDVRHFDFTGARTLMISPAVSWMASDRLGMSLRYAGTHSVSTAFASAENGHSVHLRGEYRLRYRMWLHAGYAAGVEDFENFSIDRIGDFRANAVSGGLRLDLPTLTSILAGYEHQWRSGNVNMGRVTLSLQQRF
jgi:tetratricopeptide (TPR) repeat protein